jgi:hypothetical protein
MSLLTKSDCNKQDCLNMYKMGLLSPYHKIRETTISQMNEDSSAEAKKGSTMPQLQKPTTTNEEDTCIVHDKALFCIILKQGLLSRFVSTPYYPLILRTLFSFPENAVPSFSDSASNFFGKNHLLYLVLFSGV